MSARVLLLAGNDVATQILSFPLAVGARSRAPGGPLRFVRRLNEEYADLIGDHPDRFGVIALVASSTNAPRSHDVTEVRHVSRNR